MALRRRLWSVNWTDLYIKNLYLHGAAGVAWMFGSLGWCVSDRVIGPRPAEHVFVGACAIWWVGLCAPLAYPGLALGYLSGKCFGRPWSSVDPGASPY